MSETTELIKTLRTGGLSQSEISRRTGIPQSRVSRWESGAAPVGADDALKLAALAREVGPEGACEFPQTLPAGASWEMGPEEPVTPPPAPADPVPAEPQPGISMLVGGRREEDHANSGLSALAHNGGTLIEQIEAVGRLVGDVPRREA